MPPVIEPPLVSPRTLAEAYAFLAENAGGQEGHWRPLAGGTDLYVQMNGEIGPPPARILDLWRLRELRGVTLEPGAVVLGALTTYTEIRRSPVCGEYLPALVAAAATIGAAQIQNRGTLGGNIANASPAGDTLPVLLAADAEIVVGSVRAQRPIPAASFWPSYRRTALAPDELVIRVRIPVPARRQVRFRKVGTRQAQPISKVVMALAWRDDAAGGPWRDVRVALGSVAPTPIRAGATEGSLEGRLPTPETADRAAETLATEVQPID